MKLINSMTKHPCLWTMMLSIVVYPVYFGLYAAYVHLLPIYHNAMNLHAYWTVGNGWYAQCAIFSAIPWLIITVLLTVAAKNPFGKFGTFISKYYAPISTLAIYIIAPIIDALYGEILPANHLAIMTVIAILHTITLIYKVCRYVKAKHRVAKYF